MKYELEIEENKIGLKEISNSLWNVAILNAPYRTGNLRSNIKRVENSKDKIKFIYDTSQAPYVDFLEKGIGRNKRHIGFIENLTVDSMVAEIMQAFQNQQSSFSEIPIVNLRTDKARNYERKMLRGMGVNVERRITAFERATLGFSYNMQKKNKNVMSKFDRVESVSIKTPNDAYGNRFKFVNNGSRKGQLVKK